jgi:cobalt-zinc-cadmium efflux system membrane fusion protein
MTPAAFGVTISCRGGGRSGVATGPSALRILLFLAALQVFGSLGFGSLVFGSLGAGAAVAQSAKDDSVRVTEDQLHQLAIAKVELRPFRLEKFAIGQIAYNEDVSTVVQAPFAGRVTRLVARLGERVHQGAPLLELDSSEIVQPQNDFLAAIAATNKARAKLSLATLNEARNKGLYEGKAGALKDWQQSEAELDAAQNDLRAGETAVDAARHRLRILGLTAEEIAGLQEKGQIKRSVPIISPIDGTVVARKVGPGQYVRNDPPDQLYVVADLSTMWLKAFVPEIDIPFIHVGQDLEVQVTALPGRTFGARVTHVGAVFEATTRRIEVRSEVANPEGALKAEMFASFKITTADSVTAPAVPIDAVIREGDVATVWVQREPLVFERRLVQAGLEQDGQVQIRDGLAPGDLAVARGAIFLDNQWHQ